MRRKQVFAYFTFQGKLKPTRHSAKGATAQRIKIQQNHKQVFVRQIVRKLEIAMLVPVPRNNKQ